MSQQNTALIDDIMAALDAESSQNVELIVRNTQNGATKKMALASLEQIIYSYLTTAPVVTNLASVLGVQQTGFIPSMSASGGLLGLNSSIVKNIITLGQSAISQDHFRIPHGATKVRIKAGAYNTRVYFYGPSKEYCGASEATTTEIEWYIPTGSVYILPSLDNCTPEQMLADNYQISLLF